jgi:hypothetical protein
MSSEKESFEEEQDDQEEPNAENINNAILSEALKQVSNKLSEMYRYSKKGDTTQQNSENTAPSPHSKRSEAHISNSNNNHHHQSVHSGKSVSENG